jgi:hypothetical protein
VSSKAIPIPNIVETSEGLVRCIANSVSSLNSGFDLKTLLISCFAMGYLPFSAIDVGEPMNQMA